MTVPRRVGGSFVVAGLILLAALIGEPPVVRGQVKAGKLVAPAQPLPPVRPPGPDKPFTDAVTLPVDREARRLIQAAQDYIKKKEWRIACECLQALLENREDSFLEIDGTDDQGKAEKRRVSVRAEANRLIGELPADGLEFYQVQYGQAAEARLKEALEKNDAAVLAEVALRYFHTRAGTEATTLLGTYHLDRGSYLMAALCFERLLARPDSDKLTPKTLLKAAIAYRRAGDPSAEKVWKRLADKATGGDLVFGNRRVTVEQLRAEYERPAGMLGQLTAREAYVFRTNATRSDIGAGGAAFLEPRWTASMLPLDDSQTETRKEDLDGTNWIKFNLEFAFKTLENRPILTSFFPVAAGGKLLYRTYDGVYCVSLKDGETAQGTVAAGQMLWNSRTDASLHAMARATDRRTTLEGWYSQFYRQPALGPVGVLFENSVVGTLSHDTQRVYFVDDMAVPPHQVMLTNMNVVGTGVSFHPFEKEVHFSRLTAVDIDTGKLVWKIGSRSQSTTRDDKDKTGPPVSATEFVDTFFLGPPLPLGGKLYVLVEKTTELRLVCLDPAKLDAQGLPEIVWIQSLGMANVRLMQDSQRRLQAAHLSYGDGILVCPTNAGAVLGIDLLSHSLVWAYSYRDGSPQSQSDEMQAMLLNARLRGHRMPGGSPAQERWRTSAPVIHNSKVVFTAHDAAHLHCLNLRDGRLLWHIKREDDDLYLAGVFGSRVVIVGRNYVRAVNLDEGPRDTWGKPVWKLPTGGPPSGQGVASDDVYYLPLQRTGDGPQAGPGILAVNLATGRSVSVAAKRNQELPGNLLFAEGDIISQTATSIAAYPQLKVKEAEITRRLKENPNDPIGLTERGELYLYDGKLSEAVADLRSALTHQPAAEVRTKARNKLHEALTELFQDKFALAEPYLEEYRELCRIEVPADADAPMRQKLTDEQLRREANFLSLLGRGREAQGRFLEALAAYEQFGALTGNKELISVVDEVNTRSRPDVWSRGRIKGMLDRAAPDQRRQIESAISERYQVVKDRGIGELRKFVGVFGISFPVGREAQLRLTELLLAEGSPDALTEAETKLQSLCFSPEIRKQDPTVAARAIEAMIRIYARRGLYEDAVSLYKQLGEEFKSIVVIDGKTGADLLQELITDKRFMPYLEPHGVSWKGAFKASDAIGNYQTVSTALTIEPEGNLLPFFDRHRLVLDINPNMQAGNAWSFRLLDRATNAEVWKQSGLPVAVYFMQNRSPAPSFAFASGHRLVLHLNNIVSAYNLAERKALWSYNLYGKNPLYTNNPQTSIIVNQADGCLYTVHPDGRQERLGGVAVVESSYVCLQTREGLVALDPARPGPSVLWTKSGVSLKADVFGDDEHVYIVEGGGDGVPATTRALRAQDGAAVPIPDFGALYSKRVRILGRRLLVQEDEPSTGKVCRLYDVQTGRDVWRHAFSPGAIVMRSENPALTGVVEKDHTLTLLDSRTGQVMFRSLIRAEHAEKLQSVALLSDRERYYLVLVRANEVGLSWSPNLMFGLRSLQINGPLYALNRTTGKLEWICDFLPHQNLLLEQIQDLPMLFFTSAYSKMAANGGNERSATKVTAIDKRTGKLLYDKEFLQQGPFQAIKTDPRAGSIELLRSDLKIAFRLDGSVATAEAESPANQGRTAAIRGLAVPPAIPAPVNRD